MITDADYDIMNVGADHVAAVARDLANNAIRVRDQHRVQIDQLKAEVADVSALCLRQQEEIARLAGEVETMRKAYYDACRLINP